MALSTSFSWAETYNCNTYYFQDTTTNYGKGGNPAAAAITSTLITLTSNAGAIYTYADYLPTQGSVTLTFANFVPDSDNVTPSTDCSCCDCTDDVVSTFEDGCWSIQYEVFVDEVRQGSSAQDLYFYCIIRNRIFAWIEGSCDDCCDAETQCAINSAITTYNNMLIVYNRGRGCLCTTKQLTRLQKQLDNLDNDCSDCNSPNNGCSEC